MKPLSQHYATLKTLLQLPVARLRFDPRLEPVNVVSTYRYYHRHEDLQRRWIWDIHALTFITFIIGHKHT